MEIARRPVGPDEWIAHRELRGQRQDGEEIDIRVAVGRPYETGDGDWACPVETAGLYRRHPDIVGVDALQSLCLALSLVRTLLAYFLEDGGRLFEPGGTIEVSTADLDATFSKIGA